MLGQRCGCCAASMPTDGVLTPPAAAGPTPRAVGQAVARPSRQPTEATSSQAMALASLPS